MIQSAMIFALGVFASGLIWLGLSVALVRRARRLAERRLLAGIAMRRAEFESERDELRARHAVQMHRLEREVSRVLDMATAHRLEADLKERDLMAARAELIADEQDFQDIERRLSSERNVIQDLERRHAEAGAALRGSQHALKLESKRRAGAEESLDEVSLLADQRRLAMVALRAENDSLRGRLGDAPGAPVPYEIEEARLPRAVTAREAAEQEAELEAAAPEPVLQPSASVVALSSRMRPQVVPESAEDSMTAVADATRDLKRIASDEYQDADAMLAGQPPRAPAAPPPTNIGELVALRMTPAPEPPAAPPAEEPAPNAPENRFFAALAEIRALKRAANQAGE